MFAQIRPCDHAGREHSFAIYVCTMDGGANNGKLFCDVCKKYITPSYKKLHSERQHLWCVFCSRDVHRSHSCPDQANGAAAIIGFKWVDGREVYLLSTNKCREGEWTESNQTDPYLIRKFKTETILRFTGGYIQRMENEDPTSTTAANKRPRRESE